MSMPANFPKGGVSIECGCNLTEQMCGEFIYIFCDEHMPDKVLELHNRYGGHTKPKGPKDWMTQASCATSGLYYSDLPQPPPKPHPESDPGTKPYKPTLFGLEE